MSLSNLTNDELAALGRDVFVEIESRLQAHGGFAKALRRMKAAHALAEDAASDVAAGGVIVPMDGDPKPV